MMKAATDTVITLHYTLTVDGATAETSHAREPLEVLLGRGQLIKGLEAAVEGHVAGDAFQVELAAADAYGERREGAVQRVPKKHFTDAKHLKPGMTTVLGLREGGQRRVTVHKVGMTTIDVDTNHPLAGKALTFDIELIDVRAATPEEIDHGHVHPHPATDRAGHP